MAYPTIEISQNVVNVYELNKTGELQNAYTPLQNLMTNKTLGDFTTSNLNFDRYTPVDIIVTDEYDGSQNLIINDDVNEPRLINTRMSVEENHTFRIPEHSGGSVTNVYDDQTLSKDISLLKLYDHIPELTFDGLIEGGNFKCGSYIFYFKLSDADGNLTNTIQESSIIQLHIGAINSNKVRMGMQDEISDKQVKFTLSGIDSGFDYVRVFYERVSSDNSGAMIPTYHMINQNYPIINGVASMTLSGAEQTFSISRSDLQNEFADINAAKTQKVLHNILFLGNTQAYVQDYAALQRIAWKIIPKEVESSLRIGGITGNYDLLATQGSIKGCYYNALNTYYNVGYWPDEYYRFGIVFIYDNNLLSQVFNIQGVDFSTLHSEEEIESDPTQFPSLLDIMIPKLKRSSGDTGEKYNPHQNEPEDFIFNNQYMTNSKGVIKFSNHQIIDGIEDAYTPRTLSIEFDMSKIGLGEGLEFESTSEDEPGWVKLLRKYHIKGFFFVRQKRIPSILAQGMVIGLTGKDYGSIPVVKNSQDMWNTFSFLNDKRILNQEGSEVEIFTNVETKALLVPDYELRTATYNQIFSGQEFALTKVGQVNFSATATDIIPREYAGSIYGEYNLSKVTAVPQKTKIITDGENYFSTLAGVPEEAYKTEDVNKAWSKTPPQDLTTSTSVIRGQWGAYVGISHSGFKYGDIVNIKSDDFVNNPNNNLIQFQKRFSDSSFYSSISTRYNIGDSSRIECYRGDCFPSMFTHRMMSNFQDPELPTNKKIVDPGCWAKNYAVRCTAELLATTHSNLTDDSGGWYVPSPVSNRKSNIVSLVFGILTGNIGTVISAISKMGDTQTVTQSQFANEIVQAFEVYTGVDKENEVNKTYDPTKYSDLNSLQSVVEEGYIKKVSPQEQEQNASGLGLKAIFKSDDKWELHGLAQINRADVNAVSFGQWITFPICSSQNLAFRDVDFNQATEEAKFNKKRSFYPLEEKDITNNLLESQVINGACRRSISNNQLPSYQTVPYIKQEYFNRIYWSKPNVSQEFINSYRMIFKDQYREYNKEFGAITKLESLGDNLVVIFQHGVGILPVNRSISSEADATPYLASKNVLPAQVQIITSDYGSMWKDSVISIPDANVIFGVDTVARKIWKLGTGGMEFISDHVVTKFLNDFIDLSEYDFREYQGHINVKTHYNTFKKDVIFTYYKDKPIYKEFVIYSDVKYIKDPSNERWISESGEYLKLSSDENILKSLPENQLAVDSESGVVYCNIIQEIVSWEPGTTWSLCYNVATGKHMFVTFYDWYPVESCNIDNIFFTFDKDQLDDVYNQLNDTHIRLYIDDTTKTATFNKDNSIKYYEISKQFIDPQFAEKCLVFDCSGMTIDFSGLDKPGYDYYVCWYESNGIDWEFKYNINATSISFTSEIVDLKVVYVSTEYPDFLNEELIAVGPDYLFNLRNSTPNRMLLWKHGQAGLYDNQGKIRPTHWYGKQHEFNFEFIVHDSSMIQKVFNNLRIISNKTQPKKFEYEIVGESYAWWPYKAVVWWANEKVREGHFPTLDDAYIYILNNDVSTIRSNPNYLDFPITELEYRAMTSLTSPPYRYVKLPYLEIELTDRLNRKDKSYHPDKEDFWKSIRPNRNDKPRIYDYQFNTNETVIRYDEQLNEYRIHDEQLGNDVWKYGRVRGNMQYLEDYWNIEIRPINFKWCWLPEDSTETSDLQFKQIAEARHRDKYIKIKVRYSGEDLAVIQAISTLYNESYS